MKYRTREGDMLDHICQAYYGRVDVVPQVLIANPQLTEVSPIFAAGVIIDLPKIDEPKSSGSIELWH
ncbi:MAG: tail protein X [Endozoicomonas sp. (ex Botrylloides leachii)]|nr:tail protein X [Endozoicomonas sp. (ex Botrylloides leachii)]